jgi:flagellar assembly protein FliH
MPKVAPAKFEVFQYPLGPDPSVSPWTGLIATWQEAEGQTTGVPFSSTGSESSEDRIAANLQQAAEEAKQSFEAGRQQGIREGRMAEIEGNAAAESRRIVQVAETLQQFAQERSRYLEAVEHEVVELALAVAARILRREAQMDPLLLTAAVRVALGQLADSTEVKLRVPPSELDLWAETMAHLPNLAPRPVVLPGEAMRTGECVIEALSGSVDLGIRAQLGEIERGFFDRARVGDSRSPHPPAEVGEAEAES